LNKTEWALKDRDGRKGEITNRKGDDLEIVNMVLKFQIGDLDEHYTRIGEIVRGTNFNPSCCTLSSIFK